MTIWADPAKVDNSALPGDKVENFRPGDWLPRLSRPVDLEATQHEGLHMVGWRYLIEPKRPKTQSKGGIVLVPETQEAEAHLRYIGKVLAVGEAAHQTRTTGGIDMANFVVRPEVGSWVLFSPYGGFQIRKRVEDDDDPGILLVVKDTDIHGVFNSFEDTENFWSWVAA